MHFYAVDECTKLLNQWILQLGLTDRVSVDEYNEQYDDMLSEALPNSKLMPGCLRLVRHLVAHSVPVALCTGSNSFEFKAKMKNHKELLDLFPVQVCFLRSNIFIMCGW